MLAFIWLRGGPVWLVFTIIFFAVIAWVERERISLSMFANAAEIWLILSPIFLVGWLFVFINEEGRHRSKIRRQKCTECNYDLRGSIEAGRGECPECGCAIERLD